MPEEDYFPEIEKLKLLSSEKEKQTQLTRGSPFFFGEEEKSVQTKKFKFTDWLSLHRAEAVGFGVLVAGAIVFFVSVY